jgi:hypothetical protein
MLTYRLAVLDLHVTLLQYQGLVARYFGKPTIKRTWQNVTSTASWSDISAKISVLDNDCRRCISFLGFKEQHRGNIQLIKLLEHHSKSLTCILENVEDVRSEKMRVLEWMSTTELWRRP